MPEQNAVQAFLQQPLINPARKGRSSRHLLYLSLLSILIVSVAIVCPVDWGGEVWSISDLTLTTVVTGRFESLAVALRLESWQPLYRSFCIVDTIS